MSITPGENVGPYRIIEQLGSGGMAIAADPHHLPAYFGLSEALRQTDDRAGSQVVLEEAVVHNPDNPLAYQRLGESYLLSDQPDKALMALEEAIALDPGNPELYGEQAIALLASDQNQGPPKKPSIRPWPSTSPIRTPAWPTGSTSSNKGKSGRRSSPCDS